MTTVTVDDRKRVRLPDAKPGEVFAYENKGEGRVVLTRVEPVQTKPAKVRLVRKHGYLVGVTDRVITQEEIRKALDEFP